MGEQDNRQAVEQMYRLLEKQDWNGLQEYYHQDFVQEWPQSDERIRGFDNSVAINQAYPGYPDMKMRRITASGDLVAAEVTLTYPEAGTYHGVSIFEFRDGKIAKETDYFAQPFEAPEWRSKWVEKM